MRRLTLVTAFFLICASASATSINVAGGNIAKGDIDQREYAYQKLSNGLRVLLVSDASTDKAAASLNVEVGSYHDPKDRQGLAHFLEHMLFLGTQKYPEADEYQRFISDNGGSHNAFTSRQNTNYFFDIDNRQLDAALDRFAQFFIAPLFDRFYVERERNAVHSEYQARIQDDFRRAYDAYREAVNPEHPDSKFNVVNLTTLADREGDKVRDDLIEFYQQHYSADRMSLVVVGNYTINELKQMVAKRFQAIPLKSLAQVVNSSDTGGIDTQPVPLFLPQQLPLEIQSQPLKELRQMTVNFILPSVSKFYKEKPLDFIAHILGHEGKGSLLSVLKQQGLAEALSAGGHDTDESHSVFSITVSLTKKGIRQREQVRAWIFYAIAQLKQFGVERWRYEEKRRLAAIAFRFRDNSSAISTARRLSGNLFDYPVESVLSGDYLLENFDAALIKSFLSKLTPENMYSTVIFPEAQTNQVSAFYRTPFRIDSLDRGLIKQSIDQLTVGSKALFSLPAENPFIPERFDIFADDESLSTPLALPLLRSGQEVWVKQDTSFNTPKVIVRFRILAPAIAGKLKNTVAAKLLVDIIEDNLNEYSYPALLAGSAFSLQATNRGIDISLQGYHDRLYELMERVLVEINSPTFDQSRFEQLKKDRLRFWRNADKKTPYHQLYTQLAVDLYSPYWSDEAQLNALELLTLDELKAFSSLWRNGSKVKGLMYGNLNQQWIQKWIPAFDQLSVAGESKIVPAEVVQLNNSESVYTVREVDHSDNAALLYVQGEDDSVRSQALMLLMQQVLQSPFYTSLRTEQQLGYIVFLGGMQLKDVPGSVFVVQSPNRSVLELRHAIDEFITNHQAQLPNDIQVFQRALITQITQTPSSLVASAGQYWAQIIRDQPFDYRDQLVAAIASLDADDLKQFYANSLLKDNKLIWVYSRDPQLTNPQEAVAQKPFAKGNKRYRYP